MNWRDVAARDVRDAARSWTVRLLVVLSTLLSAGYASAHSTLGEATFAGFLDGIAGPVAMIVPALALLLGSRSIVHERTSGSLLLSLSLPLSRRDLLLGTFVGRAAVLLAPTLLALAAAGAVAAVRYGTEGASLYPWFLFATALYGVAFLGVAVGLSASTAAERWVTMGAVGAYLLLAILWDEFHSLTLLVLHRFDFAVLREMPDWALLFRLLEPSESYYRLLRFGLDLERAGRYAGAGTPVYVDWWAGLLLLVLWSVVPLALGYRRFRTADL